MGSRESGLSSGGASRSSSCGGFGLTVSGALAAFFSASIFAVFATSCSAAMFEGSTPWAFSNSARAGSGENGEDAGGGSEACTRHSRGWPEARGHIPRARCHNPVWPRPCGRRQILDLLWDSLLGLPPLQPKEAGILFGAKHSPIDPAVETRV